ncbi:MAG: hypothetical protein H6641_12605 [Caldilineaceae bacterium]|nr:hypothetical protein [Caldilineaceae bacterium]
MTTWIGWKPNWQIRLMKIMNWSFLNQIPYKEVDHETIILPEWVYHQNYERKVLPQELYVPSRY